MLNQRNIHKLFFYFLTLVFFSSGSFAVTVTFQQGVSPDSAYSGCEDTYIQSQYPTTNYGDADLIVTGRNSRTGGGGTRRILIKFDLSSIPQNSIITSAKLYLSPTASQSYQFVCYMPTKDWIEDSSTWNSYNGTDLWNTAGGDFNTNAVAYSCSLESGWHTWIIDSAVQDWVNGDSPNYGLLIKLSLDTGSVRTLNNYVSSEDTSSADRPKLVVSYTIADSNPPAAVSDLSAIAGEAKTTLSWTSPGDDGTSGNIINGQYKIKYTTLNQITNESQWNAAPYELTWTTNAIPGSIQSLEIEGLTGNTTYWFAIKTADEAGLWSSLSNSVKVITYQDSNPPVISNITVSGITNTQATINFNTDEPAVCFVQYGATISYGTQTSSDTMNLNHSFTIYSLSAQTTYHYRITATDFSNNPVSSSDSIFVTKAVSVPADEYLWLHVDGKYIRTSAYANPPDTVFIPVGCSYTDDASLYGCALSTSYILNLKSEGINFIRFPFFFNARTNYAYTSNIDVTRLINEKLTQAVVRCKNNQTYIILDDHEYFHNTGYYNDSFPGWLPAGNLWSEMQIQTWINAWKAIATRFKDEPWVMGYELQNEPYTRFDGDLTAETLRSWFARCIQAIRSVDKKHIIFLGDKYFNSSSALLETWEPIAFKPDEPYNQVVFSIHEYTSPVYEGGLGYLRAGPIIDYTRDNYGVTLICTECGPVEGESSDSKVDYWNTLLAMYKFRNLGWNNWLQYTSPDTYDYPEIWEPVAQSMHSSIPSKGSGPGEANKIICSVNKPSVPADNNSYALAEARITDINGITLTDAGNQISFTVSVGGVIVSSNPVNASYGKAELKIKADIAGTISITAQSAALASGTTTLVAIPAGSRKEYVTSDWQPPVSTYLRPANILDECSLNIEITDSLSALTSAQLELIMYDVDSVNEVDIYINDNGPITVPAGITGNNTYKKAYISIPQPYLITGTNNLVFRYMGGDTVESIHGVTTYYGFGLESAKIILDFNVDNTAPQVYELECSTISETSVFIKWKTNEPSTTQLSFGKSPACETALNEGTSLLLDHSVTINNLDTGDLYYYRIQTKDASGNTILTDPYTFEISNPTSVYTNELLIYPNPFTETVTFFLNFPPTDVAVSYELKIHTLSGKSLRNITGVLLPGENKVEWDGTSGAGQKIVRGVYLYVFKAVINSGKITKKGKIVKTQKR